MIKILYGLFACVFFAPCVLAWNAEGHMVVAQIAYNHLSPQVKARCDTLIAVMLTNSSVGTSNFVTASVWADDFKTPLGTAIWHYIDLPFSLDGTPTNGVGAAAFDVVRAINLSIATLQNNAQTVSNQAVSLRYLLHFVGDIHQPLHCSTAVSAAKPGGDAGGNSFSITGNWNNLHSLWDAGGGYLSDSVSRPLNAAGQATLSNKVAAIEADFPYVPNNGPIPNPMDWAQEGVGLAQTVSYVGITQNSTPSTNYLNTATATTEQRMALAGHRLADLLNAVLAPGPIVLSSVVITNGSFQFSWSASPAATYHIQAKTNLNDPTWTELTSITAASNSVSFSEAPAPARRFYRVVQ